MATSFEVEAEFLSKMKALYRVPYGVQDTDASLAEYAGELSEYPANALREGWIRLKRSYKKRDWPALGEILPHLQAEHARAPAATDPALIARLIAMTAKEFAAWHRIQPAPLYTDSWHWERREEIALGSPAANLAAREGWIGTLVDYSVEHARLPVTAEFAKLKARGNAFLAALRSQDKALPISLARLLLRRYVDLAEMAGLDRTEAQAIYQHGALAP